MKILGLSCGRKMGNSEIAVKEALMGAEEAGAQVEILRLFDLQIKPCQGCLACGRYLEKGEPAQCVIKDDDMLFFFEKWREADGLIIGAPAYLMGAPGYFKVVADRMTPNSANATIMDSMKGERKRPVGLISVGGSATWDWVSMGLSSMKVLTFTELELIDQLQVVRAAIPGQILLDDEAMKKARTLGRRVAEAGKIKSSDMKFLGDDPGLCPACHSDCIVPSKMGSPVECAVCGFMGSLKIEGDKITMIPYEKEAVPNRTTTAGRVRHLADIKMVSEEFITTKDTVEKRIAKYKSYLTPMKPPAKSKS